MYFSSFRSLLILIFFTLFSSAGTLEVGERDSYWILPYCQYAPIEYMRDTPKDLSDTTWVKDITKLELNPLNKGFWMKLTLSNQDEFNKNLFFISKKNYVFYMEYFLVDQNGTVLLHRERPIKSKNDKLSYAGLHRIFPLTLKNHDKIEVFFKIQSFNMGLVSFNLITQDYMTRFYQDYSFFKGIYFGIMIIMMLYNMVLYLFFKFSSYLYYVLYVGFFTLYSASYSGYLHQYTNLDTTSIEVLLSVGYVGFLVFVSSFIKELFLKKGSSIAIRWIGYIQFYLLIILIFKIIFIYQNSFLYIEFFTTLQNAILPFYYLFILYFLYETSHKHNNYLAQWYLISWGIIGLIGFLQILAFHNVLSMERGFDHLFEASMAFETLLFSILLSLRIKEIKREKDEKEKMLIQQNKLASMGEMIVSIAHQWRQPLAEINGIVMNLDLDYQNKNLDNERFQKHLLDIEDTTQHLSSTMNDFMDFFNHKKEVNCFSVFELFENAIKLIQMSSRAKVEIVYNMQSDIEISTYRSELLQVLLIIINNSMDAFVTSKVKHPKIELGATKKGDYIYFTIEDNGGGIPSHIIEKIFEPYFTSKPKTQGTGLGLYILKIIIEKSMLGEVSLKNSVHGVVCNFKIIDFKISEKMLI